MISVALNRGKRIITANTFYIMNKRIAFCAAAVLSLTFPLCAQSNSPVTTTTSVVIAATNAVAEVHTNTAIIPVPRPDNNSMRRTDIVLKRAKDNPGAAPE